MRSSYKIKKRTEFCTLLYANGTLFLTWAPPQTPPSPSTPKGEREGRGNGAKGDFIRNPPLLDISQLIAEGE